MKPKFAALIYMVAIIMTLLSQATSSLAAAILEACALILTVLFHVSVFLRTDRVFVRIAALASASLEILYLIIQLTCLIGDTSSRVSVLLIPVICLLLFAKTAFFLSFPICGYPAVTVKISSIVTASASVLYSFYIFILYIPTAISIKIYRSISNYDDAVYSQLLQFIFLREFTPYFAICCELLFAIFFFAQLTKAKI